MSTIKVTIKAGTVADRESKRYQEEKRRSREAIQNINNRMIAINSDRPVKDTDQL